MNPLLFTADPGAVQAAAGNLAQWAVAHGRSAEEMDSCVPGEQAWSGAARDVFATRVAEKAQRLRGHATACGAGARSIETYAHVLHAEQANAKAGVNAFNRAKDAHDTLAEQLRSGACSAQAVGQILRSAQHCADVAGQAVQQIDAAGGRLEDAANKLHHELTAMATQFQSPDRFTHVTNEAGLTASSFVAGAAGAVYNGVKGAVGVVTSREFWAPPAPGQRSATSDLLPLLGISSNAEFRRAWGKAWTELKETGSELVDWRHLREGYEHGDASEMAGALGTGTANVLPLAGVVGKGLKGVRAGAAAEGADAMRAEAAASRTGRTAGDADVATPGPAATDVATTATDVAPTVSSTGGAASGGGVHIVDVDAPTGTATSGEARANPVGSGLAGSADSPRPGIPRQGPALAPEGLGGGGGDAPAMTVTPAAKADSGGGAAADTTTGDAATTTRSASLLNRIDEQLQAASPSVQTTTLEQLRGQTRRLADLEQSGAPQADIDRQMNLVQRTLDRYNAMSGGVLKGALPVAQLTQEQAQAVTPLLRAQGLKDNLVNRALINLGQFGRAQIDLLQADVGSGLANATGYRDVISSLANKDMVHSATMALEEGRKLMREGNVVNFERKLIGENGYDIDVLTLASDGTMASAYQLKGSVLGNFTDNLARATSQISSAPATTRRLGIDILDASPEQFANDSRAQQSLQRFQSAHPEIQLRLQFNGTGSGSALTRYYNGWPQ